MGYWSSPPTCWVAMAFSETLSLVSALCSSLKAGNLGLCGTIKVGLQPFPERAAPPGDMQWHSQA